MAKGNENSGRKDNQKMKPYLVYQYLLRETDENNVRTAYEIADYLDSLGIEAERRSVYKDIDAINKAMWMLQNKTDMPDAVEVIDADEYDQEKPIVYDPSKKGFYVRERGYSFDDIRLIAECIYSSKYITEKRAKDLVSIMKDFLSEKQASKIKTDAIVTNRVRTFNDALLDNVSKIYDAMSSQINGNPHAPEKITFHYLKSDVNNVKNQVEKSKGAKYSVSPYKLIISDGNYYLLAFDDFSKKIRTYRVDRMKNLRLTNVPREGEEEFKQIDLSNYLQRTFSMFSGRKERVKMRFVASLLDAALEKLGQERVHYVKIDEHHFEVTAPIEISNQFFGWVCGFGTDVTILEPASVRQEFSEYIGKIQKKYNE